MEHIDVSNLSLAILGAEIFRFVVRATDLKDPVESRGCSGFVANLKIFKA